MSRQIGIQLQILLWSVAFGGRDAMDDARGIRPGSTIRSGLGRIWIGRLERKQHRFRLDPVRLPIIHPNTLIPHDQGDDYYDDDYDDDAEQTTTNLPPM